MAIACSFIIAPRLIHTLDNMGYGIWVFIQDLANLTDLLYVGVGAFVVREIAVLKKNTDNALLKSFTSQTLGLYSVVGGLAAVLILLVAPPLVRPMLTGDASTHSDNIVFVVLLVGLTLYLGFVGSAFSGILTGYSLFLHLNICDVFFAIFRALAIILLFGSGDSLVKLAAIVAITQGVKLGMLMFLVKHKCPEAFPRWSLPTRAGLKQAYTFGALAFTFLLYMKLMQYSDTMLISYQLGASEVAKFSIPQQMVGYVWILVLGITQVLYPRYAASSEGGSSTFQKLFLESGLAAGVVLGSVVVAVVAIAPNFVSVWIDSEYSAMTKLVILPMMATTFVRGLFVELPVSMLLAKGSAAACVRILILETIIKIPISYYALSNWGIAGMCYATLIVAVVFEFIAISYLVSLQTGVGMLQQFRVVLPPSIAAICFTGVIFAIIQSCFDCISFASLAMFAAVGCAISAAAGIAIQRLSAARLRAISIQLQKEHW